MLRAAVLVFLLLFLVPASQAQEVVPRWTEGASNPYGHLPIRVAVVHDPDANEERLPIIVEEVASAFAWWESGGNGALEWAPAFTNASSVEEADLVVYLAATDHVCGSVEAAGCARPPTDEAPGVVVLPLLQAGGIHVSPQRMVMVARHEVGHALGLRHSGDPTDIMYPSLHLSATGGSPSSWATYAPYVATGVFGLGIAAVAAARWRKGRGASGGGGGGGGGGVPLCRTGPYHDFEGNVCTQCGHVKR